jgi:hypothetical protein
LACVEAAHIFGNLLIASATTVVGPAVSEMMVVGLWPGLEVVANVGMVGVIRVVAVVGRLAHRGLMVGKTGVLQRLVV